MILFSLLTVGDDLYQLNGDNQEFLGVIDTINFESGQVTILDSPIPSSGAYTSQFNSKFK
jgi:hypothetical protein